jgi:hypothetical protein
MRVVVAAAASEIIVVVTPFLGMAARGAAGPVVLIFRLESYLAMAPSIAVAAAVVLPAQMVAAMAAPAS